MGQNLRDTVRPCTNLGERVSYELWAEGTALCHVDLDKAGNGRVISDPSSLIVCLINPAFTSTPPYSERLLFSKEMQPQPVRLQRRRHLLPRNFSLPQRGWSRYEREKLRQLQEQLLLQTSFDYITVIQLKISSKKINHIIRILVFNSDITSFESPLRQPYNKLTQAIIKEPPRSWKELRIDFRIDICLGDMRAIFKFLTYFPDAGLINRWKTSA